MFKLQREEGNNNEKMWRKIKSAETVIAQKEIAGQTYVLVTGKNYNKKDGFQLSFPIDLSNTAKSK